MKTPLIVGGAIVAGSGLAYGLYRLTRGKSQVAPADHTAQEAGGGFLVLGEPAGSPWKTMELNLAHLKFARAKAEVRWGSDWGGTVTKANPAKVYSAVKSLVDKLEGNYPGTAGEYGILREFTGRSYWFAYKPEAWDVQTPQFPTSSILNVTLDGVRTVRVTEGDIFRKSPSVGIPTFIPPFWDLDDPPARLYFVRTGFTKVRKMRFNVSIKLIVPPLPPYLPLGASITPTLVVYVGNLTRANKSFEDAMDAFGIDDPYKLTKHRYTMSGLRNYLTSRIT